MSFIADTTTANAQVRGEGGREGVRDGGKEGGVVGESWARLDFSRTHFSLSPSLPPSLPPSLSLQVRSLSETVRLDARTKLLNPKFYEGTSLPPSLPPSLSSSITSHPPSLPPSLPGMLATGYEGAREITKRLRNTMGW